MMADPNERYCPSCGNFLARMNPNGTVDLGAHSSMKFKIELRVGAEAIPDIDTAECQRLFCKFKRWWKRKG